MNYLAIIYLTLPFTALSAVNAATKIDADKDQQAVNSTETKKKVPLIAEVPGAYLLKKNGGWCWYQSPRAIATKQGQIVFSTISGDSYAGYDAGDLWVSSWQPQNKTCESFELHDKFEVDDHDVAGLLERPDGRILAVYGKHGSDHLQRRRITTRSGDISSWSQEDVLDVGVGYTYSNIYRLSDEKGRIYNFSRSIGNNPNCTLSDDHGKTWTKGWRLLNWAKSDYEKNPLHTGVDGSRPYLRYCSNHKDTIHFVSTEDHPRAFDNSIYHGYYKDNKLHHSNGTVLSDLNNNPTRLTPQSYTKVFQGGKDKVAWTADVELDSKGNPYAAFSVQLDGAETRGSRNESSCNDHRYWYARFDGKQWHSHEVAYAGTKLYTRESDYTGLIALDPNDPNTVVISTNANPVTGEALISSRDKKRHWELFRGKTLDQGKTWNWTAITKNSALDNLRPNIVDYKKERIILWCRGTLRSYTDYQLDLCGLIEQR